MSALVVLGAIVVVRVIADGAVWLSRRFAHRRPMIQKLESAARFVMYVVVAAICVGLSIRLDSAAVAVIGGALACAVGFAMRDVVAAFIAGITIMVDRPFQAGDRVAYAGEYGDVVKVGLHSVQVNTLDHNIVTIPNNRVLTDVTSSGNDGALEMQVAMDFYIGVDQNTELAAELIREACLTSPYVFLERPVPILVRQVILESCVAVHLEARPHVLYCQYEKPSETGVRLRVLRAFQARGILPPAVLHCEVTGAFGSSPWSQQNRPSSDGRRKLQSA